MTSKPELNQVNQNYVSRPPYPNPTPCLSVSLIPIYSPPPSSSDLQEISRILSIENLVDSVETFSDWGVEMIQDQMSGPGPVLWTAIKVGIIAALIIVGCTAVGGAVGSSVSPVGTVIGGTLGFCIGLGIVIAGIKTHFKNDPSCNDLCNSAQ
jgi:hypothetical protein